MVRWLLLVVLTAACSASAPERATRSYSGNDPCPRLDLPPHPECDPEGWCAVSGRGASAPVWAVSGTADDDVWVLGPQHVAHWDGVFLSRIDGWFSEPVSAVFALARDDVWFGTRGHLLHWDGQRVTRTDLPDREAAVDGIWAASDDDLWATGDSFWHLDHGTWTEVDVGASVRSVWGLDARHVWAVGADTEGLPAALFFDGDRWHRRAATGSGSLRAVWGSGPDDVWLGGDEILLHWDGASLRWHQPLDSTVALTGTSAGDVWAVSHALSSPPNWTVWHFDGTDWKADAEAPPGEDGLDAFAPSSASRLLAPAPGEVWLAMSGRGGASSGGLFRFGRNGWEPMAPHRLFLEPVSAVAVTSSGLWTFGEGVRHAADGDLALEENAGLEFAWSAGGDDWWALGGRKVYRHRAGSTAATDLSPFMTRWIGGWVSPAGDLWAASDSAILHGDETGLHPLLPPRIDVTGVFGDGPDLLLAGSRDRRTELFRLADGAGPLGGRGWKREAPPPMQNVRTGLRWNDARWVAGDEGVARQVNGKWEDDFSKATSVLLATSDRDLWAAGDGLWKWNGHAWDEVAPLTGIRAMAACEGAPKFAVTDDGVLWMRLGK